MSSSSGLERPAKRQCPSDDPPPEIRRHEKVYYPGGDIVLLSLPKENITTAFRVDKFSLGRHSPVFEGMFSLPPPNPDTNVEKYDGVPFVQLHDNAQDLSDFLGALYEMEPIGSGKRLARDTVRLVTGMLKLATKYEVKSLRMRIIDVLALDWPKDLELWDENELEIDRVRKKLKRTGAFEPELDGNLDDYLPEPCEVIRLARDYDIPELLPAAFYHLSRIPPFATTELDLPEDAAQYKEYLSHIKAGGRSAKFSLLYPTDHTRLRIGCHRISEFFKYLSSHPSRFHCWRPCKEEACLAAISRILTKYLVTAPGELDGLRVLRKDLFCEVLAKEQNDNWRPCYSCMTTMQQDIQTDRRWFWDKLPRMFGLVTNKPEPGWGGYDDMEPWNSS